MKIAYWLCASTALVLPAMASAQSSGTIAVEADEEIVVVGSVDRNGVEGIVVPDSSKAKAVLTEEIIKRQTPGQSILDVINLVPGVSFQNNDGYGAAGGTLTIRGFSADRVSLTFDGVPLNDSGNYAIYSSQQLDPELIEQVNVNLGSTDVDSPTASAAGGTVNYRTRRPRNDLGASVTASYGDFDFNRVFGVIDTGDFTGFGTRAFIAASTARNDNPYNGFGKIRKQQYNSRIVQDLGSNGDFLSLSGNYSVSRNNFFGSSPIRTDLTPLTTGGLPRAVPDRFPRTEDERFYEIAPCQVNTVARPGVVDAANTCGSTFDERINPSNTGNIRGGSRFSLSDQLTITVDPSFQYVKANGGGGAVGQEGLRDINPADPDGAGSQPAIATPATCNTTPNSAFNTCVPGYLGGSPFFGRDLNGDGDRRDSIRVLTPSQTRTDRYGLTSSLIYEINEDHTARVSYTYDRARHRQTGEVGFLDVAGRAINVFPVNNPLADVTGSILQKRDRLSYAILNQISGEYRGSFIDDRLDVNIGLRAPFFKRELDNRCFTSSAGGFVECFGTNTAAATQYATLNPKVQGPREVTRKYDKLLPNLGLTFDVTNDVSLFANYAKGLSVPSTDNLYNAFFFAEGTEGSQPRPETTDTFDAGMRFTSRQVQAQFAGWFTKFKDRTASAFDPELNASVFRNLGEVDKYGFDGSVAFQPVPEIVLYAFGSYLNSEIKDDVIIGETAAGVPLFGPTAGKREAGSPTYTFGGRAQAMLGPIELGVQAKRTGKRFVFDTNEPVFAFVAGAPLQVYGASTPAYTLVDLDARLSLAPYGLERTYFQLNATNVFDKLYVGGFGGGLNQTINRNAAGTITGFGSPPFVQIGAPRTISGSVIIGF